MAMGFGWRGRSPSVQEPVHPAESFPPRAVVWVVWFQIACLAYLLYKVDPAFLVELLHTAMEIWELGLGA